jgi:hypothetical protein
LSDFGFSVLAGLAFSEDASVDVLDFSAAGVEEGAADSLDEDSAFDASLRDSEG